MKLPGLRRSAAMWMAAALTALAAVAVPVAQAQAPAAKHFDVLQLNLCNSGFADCCSAGKAVNSAIALIQRRRPDVVTLNESCARDITLMTRETGYLWEFAPAGDKSE
ncbi:hypothetical protein ACWDKQ_22755 [Saccharopolyspora sp. NPDC000995]